MASNYDDHLRNQGFLMHEAGRWSLSPAYDLNPVPEIDRLRVSKTPISEEHEEPSIAGVLAVAGRFGLKAPAAKSILREVFNRGDEAGTQEDNRAPARTARATKCAGSRTLQPRTATAANCTPCPRSSVRR